MATIYWAPTKTAVAQVGTLTITSFNASTVYAIIVGGMMIDVEMLNSFMTPSPLCIAP